MRRKNVIRTTIFSMVSLFATGCATGKVWVVSKTQTGGVVGYQDYDPAKDRGRKLSDKISCFPYQVKGVEYHSPFAADASANPNSKPSSSWVELRYECGMGSTATDVAQASNAAIAAAPPAVALQNPPEKIEGAAPNPSNDGGLVRDDDHSGFADSAEDGWHFYFGAGLALASSVKFESIRVRDTTTGNSASGSVSYDVTKPLFLSAELRKMGSNEWGFGGGYTYMLSQDVTSGTATVGGYTVTSSVSNTNFQVSYFSANAIYQWDHLFLPFGVNYSIVNFDMKGATSWSVIGGLGAQVGLGIPLNDRLSVEGFARALRVNITSSQSGFNVNYGDGFMSNLDVMLRFRF